MIPTGNEPAFKGSRFSCPNCGVVAHQKWGTITVGGGRDDDILRATCVECGQHAYWVKQKMAWPRPRVGTPPSPDMPEALVDAYEEARQVAVVSPRAAAALLRMVVEQLVKRLTPDGKGTLHKRIGQLEAEGVLPRWIIDSMVAVKLGGNNAMHDGHVHADGSDDIDVVLMLFALVDNIVENAIRVPKWKEEFLGEKQRPEG